MSIKKNLYYNLKDKYPIAFAKYERYKANNSEYHQNHKFKSYLYLGKELRNEIKLNFKETREESVREKADTINFVESSVNNRTDCDKVVEELLTYDIISFDIFDTVLLRKVENPRDVFLIMSSELNFPNFKAMRIKAEQTARERLYERCNSYEVTLSEIYDIIQEDYNIDKEKWMCREVELEMDLCAPNPYFFNIYNKLLKYNKRIIFTSDMYLSSEVIANMLHKCGYDKYEKLFVSCELHMSKTIGTMQNYLVNVYAPDCKIIHIGDNYNADIVNSNKFGIATIYYNSVRELGGPYREDFINNLGGSFYRAIINNEIHCGTWKEDVHYEHGFRVAGILACGYCEFINRRAKEVNADLILFCSRDCDIIHKVYNKFYNEIENKYIRISRYALMNVCIERYLFDIFGRIFEKSLEKPDRDTIREIFQFAGMEYLINGLSDFGIDADKKIDRKVLEGIRKYLFNSKEQIISHNESQILGATKYFDEICFGHKNILVVDIGWNGSCITTLRYFLNEHFPNKYNVYGSLMIANNNETVGINIMDNVLNAYLISPIQNCDLLRMQFKKDKKLTEINNQIFEYMFTSTDDSLLAYDYQDGVIKFVYNTHKHYNDEEIKKIHQGIIAFADVFNSYTNKYNTLFNVSPYVACGAFYKSIRSKEYIENIYCNFAYEGFVGNYTNRHLMNFGSLLQEKPQLKEVKGAKKILLVTHSFSYSGAPNSLLRIGKVLKNLGYDVEVWSPFEGGMSAEFEEAQIFVRYVKQNELDLAKIKKIVKGFSLAICNTVLTYEYYRQLRKYMPVIWYIREASNIPDYCSKTNMTLMYDTLIHAKELVCVSDYAESYLRKYNKNIRVVPNCVEDISSLAKEHVLNPTDKVRFIQMGSLEKRKGYDKLIGAFEQLPKEYLEQCELYFAGQIIPNAKVFADDILNRAKKLPNVNYMGIIKDKEYKIRVLSDMDVVIVASLDESCSLVALEGAMMSKPLIVTENVGAKYIVSDKSGFIVKTADVDSLKQAIMSCIDLNKSNLKLMGQISRKMYDTKSSMQRHTKDINDLVISYIKTDNSLKRLGYRIFHQNKFWERLKYKQLIKQNLLTDEFNNLYRIALDKFPRLAKCAKNKRNKITNKMSKKLQNNLPRDKKVIVSLTSYPPRIKKLHIVIRTLLKQYFKPDEIVLWLAEEQFPNKYKDLPKSLLKLRGKCFKIKWCDDLKPHKKYYYTMKQNPEAIVITVDDDFKYAPDMVGKLYSSYLKHPHAVSCLRAHRIKFNTEGNVKLYKDWGIEDNSLIDTPDYSLLPTGVSGVLYPPHCLPKEAFNKDSIRELCLMTDDLWLKIMSAFNGFPSVLVEKQNPIKCIPDTQNVAISLENIQLFNDINMQKILNKYNYMDGRSILSILRGTQDTD